MVARTRVIKSFQRQYIVTEEVSAGNWSFQYIEEGGDIRIGKGRDRQLLRVGGYRTVMCSLQVLLLDHYLNNCNISRKEQKLYRRTKFSIKYKERISSKTSCLEYNSAEGSPNTRIKLASTFRKTSWCNNLT